MNGIAKETVAGFNEQVQMIKEMQKKYPGQKIRVSLTTFNHLVDTDLFMADPDTLKQMRTATDYSGSSRYRNTHYDKRFVLYKPSGMTALYDAIGMSVKKLKKETKHELKNNKASVVVVIITDGHENSSRKYSYEKIQKLIGKLEKKPNWTFSYLGATPDAVDIARSLNIDKSNALRIDLDEMEDIMTDDLPFFMDDYLAEKERGIIKKRYLSRNG
jgi:hypothetical protein